MHILYGVVGEGMGHATRSRVILEHLLAGGHTVRVVVSGHATAFLQESFQGQPRISIHAIHGLTLNYADNVLDVSESVKENLAAAPKGLLRNLRAYAELAEDGFEPDVVISDYESWAYLYGINHRIPVISVDNMQVLNRCVHTADVTDDKSAAFRLAKAAVKVKLPGAYHYVVSSFFFPEPRKPRTTLVPPILRPDILTARPEDGDHVVVYQRALAPDALAALLGQFGDVPFKVYGAADAPVHVPANVAFMPFSGPGFIEDLRTARAVIAGGGYSLMGEAVHLGKPMLAVPIEGQYEQELNARYLEKNGYGVYAPTLTADAVRTFLAGTATHKAALAGYPRQDNTMLFGVLDALLRFVRIDEPAPDGLDVPHMGTYRAPPLPPGF